VSEGLAARAQQLVQLVHDHILHGGGGESLPEKRFWYFKWDNYVKAGKVIHVPKWFSKCTVDDLRKNVNN
jgi:hypothetical protein